MENREECTLTPQMKNRLIQEIVLKLDLLCVELPFRIVAMPCRKEFSDNWLNKHGFDYLIDAPKYYPILKEDDEII